MKYRIKNPEIEKAVRYLFKCNFPKNGLTAYELKPEARLVRFYVDEKSSVSNCNLIFELHESLVEEVVEYDPNEWNEMCVLPPANGQYLVYCKSEKWFSIWHRYEDHWRNGNWHTYFDNDGDGDLKDFKYRSLDFLKAEGKE